MSTPTGPPGGPSVPELDGLADAVAHMTGAVTDLKALPEALDYGDADDLLDSTVALDAQITKLQALRAQLLRRIDRTEAYRARACVTTASWWRSATRRDHAAASRQVHTARRLGDLPALATALDAAEVTLDHVDVVTRACKPGRTEEIIGADGILTELARSVEPGAVRVACRRIADLVDPDGTTRGDGDDGTSTDDATDPSDCAAKDGDDQAAPHQGIWRDPERGLWLHRSFDGRWRMVAELEDIVGERAFNLLMHADTPDDPGTDPSQRRSPAQRRHDAFAQLLKGAEEIPDLATRHGARPRVLLTIDLLSLLGHDACASRRPRLASGGEIALDAAVELLEEASITPVLQMGPFRSVAVGRTQRTLPDWLRPLLAVTHRTCRGPACDRPIPWTQAAHLDDWIAGGDTDLDRTIPACGAHHRLRDIDGWQVDYDPDTARVTWTRPDGSYRTTTEPPDP